ncbi:MAG: glycosyltransferase [Gammaproteobacteria bacterium]|nr:glycosyltransferase [Gammaproteobacteria bacterium]
MNSPYGRFFNLSRYLSESGHSVHLVLISYRKGETEQKIIGQLGLTSISANPNPLTAFIKINSILKTSRPDWVFGFSDTYYGILAEYFASKYQCKSLVDAYDNYEAYLPLLKPVHWLWRRSLSRANLVTCAGKSLQDLLRRYRKTMPTHILQMSADQDVFFPQAKAECRKLMHLPMDVKLIGYHGSISKSRDIDLFFSLAKKISAEKPDIRFVISGRKDKEISVPEAIIDKGYLPDSQVPLLLNSLDLLVVTNRESKFGKYSYPVKLYEAMACNIPVIASRTESTEWILRDYPQFLVPAGDEKKMELKIYQVLENHDIDYGDSPSWKEITGDLDKLIGEN